MAEPRIRLNFTVPVPIIATMLAQAAVILWCGAAWKTSIDNTIAILDTRVSAVEKNASNNTQIVERVKGVEVKIEGLEKQGVRIEDKLDKTLERRR